MGRRVSVLASDPMTERIEDVRRSRGLTRQVVQELTGMEGKKWLRRVRSGRWAAAEVESHARVLRVSVAELTGGVAS